MAPWRNAGLLMMADTYHAFRTMLDEQGIIFSYCGYMSEKLVVGLGEAIKQKMELDAADTNTSKRVFSIFIEQIQNIIRYSADRAGGAEPSRGELPNGVITIGRDGSGRFFVAGANMVQAVEVPKLKQRLDHINSLDQNSLKAYYKERLRNAPDADSKGASIGLIEIARRAAGPIEYDVKPVSNDMAFFCLKAFV